MNSSPPALPRVHRFSAGDYWQRPEMNRLQKSFYVRHFAPAFEAGMPADIKGQGGYVTMMLHDLLGRWRSDQEAAIAGMRALLSAYPQDSRGVRDCLSDMHFARGEWRAGFDLLNARSRFRPLIALNDELDVRITSTDVILWSSPPITKAGYQNFRAMNAAIQRTLDEYHDEWGVNLAVAFWRQIHADEPLERTAASIEPLVGTAYSVEDLTTLVGATRARPPSARTVLGGFDGLEVTLPTLWPNASSYDPLIQALFRQVSRDGENTAREEAGLPRVGEGLVSEIQLLHALRESFPDERVDHQVRPWWLAPQSLDIVFTHRNVAVEYQGAQHSRPVELFGGQAAFKKQRDRDANKRALCEDNGMHLIEVHPGYALADVIAEVRAAFC